MRIDQRIQCDSIRLIRDVKSSGRVKSGLRHTVFSINDRAKISKFSTLIVVVGNDDRYLEDGGISNDARESSAAEKVRRVVRESMANDRTFGTWRYSLWKGIDDSIGDGNSNGNSNGIDDVDR